MKPKTNSTCEQFLFFSILCLVLSSGLLMCGNDDSETESTADTDSDIDSDSDTDSDTDTDTNTGTEDTDTGECDETEQWGDDDSVQMGVPVSNWQLTGIFDQDGDGTISKDEQEPTEFSLVDIYCAGKSSIVLIKSDAT